MPESCSSCGVPMEPAAENDFARGAHSHPLTIADQRRARAAQAHRSASRSSCSLSVSAWVHTVRLARERRRLQERLGRAHAEAAALIHVEVADAGVVAGVEVVDAREAGLLGGLGERIEDVPAQTLFGDAPLAARAMQVAVRATSSQR